MTPRINDECHWFDDKTGQKRYASVYHIFEKGSIVHLVLIDREQQFYVRSDLMVGIVRDDLDEGFGFWSPQDDELAASKDAELASRHAACSR